MLSLLNIGAGAKSHQYYVEYAQECGEPRGQFHGAAAESLQILEQEVTSEKMQMLLQGFSPNGNKLCRNAGADHRGGWDATFSAPKSVSIVWSSANEELRHKIETAQLAAVKVGIKYYEDNASFVRLGKGGCIRSKAELAVALFEHGSSRAGEPQLHTHAIIFNAGKLKDRDEWRTLESRDFYLNQMAASAFYKAELAHELRKLGFAIARTKDSFEIVGVPQSVCDAQSSRAKQIKDQLEKAGFEIDIATARAKELSALKTRPEKDRLGRDFERWQQENVANGFGQKHIRSIQGDSTIKSGQLSAKDVTEIVNSLGAQDSTFASYAIDRKIAEAMIGVGDSEAALSEIARVKGSGQIVEVGKGRHNEVRYSTPQIIAVEQEIMNILERRSFERLHTVKWKKVQRQLKNYPQLNTEQREAVKRLTRLPGGVQFVEGQAGTGKSTMLGVVKAIYEKEGRQLIGLSFTNKAARNLEASSGIKSQSVDGFLLREQSKPTLSSKSIVIIDEAGMLDSRKTLALSKLCEEAKAKLIFVGDAKQIQPITAGQAFEMQQKRFVTSRLVEVFRQKFDWERAAVSEIRNGDIKNALAAFDEHAQLKIMRTPKAVRTQIVSDWHKHVTENKNDHAVIVCSRNVEVTNLNRMAREKLKESGKLNERIELDTKHGLAEFSVGDKIIFTSNQKPLGIYNSTLADIKSVSSKKIVVVTELGKTVSFNPQEFKAFRHGYAITAHKSQGSTVQRAFVYVDGFAMDREKFYVSVSRGRRNNTIYADRTSFHEMTMDEKRQLKTLSREEKLKFLKSHWRDELASIVGISHQKDTSQDYPKMAKNNDVLTRITSALRNVSLDLEQQNPFKRTYNSLKECLASAWNKKQGQTESRANRVRDNQ